MIRFIVFSFFLIINIIQTDIYAAPANIKEIATSQAPQQTFYLEKFSDLLNVIDDEDKRATFIKDINKTVHQDIFSWSSIKQTILYVVKLCVIVFVYFILKFLGLRLLNYQMRVLSDRRQEKLLKNLNTEDNYLLLETLASLFKSIFIWVLRIIFFLLFINVLGVSISPLIYGVSFLGFGVTLASQNIIKDFINGILIIMDGSMAVGELIECAGHRGVVENITLRSISVRNKTGELITIPFSNIIDVRNYSRNFSRIRIEVVIAHYQPIESVKDAFNDAFLKIKKDYPKKIIEDMNFLGVTNITHEGSYVGATFKAKPDPTFVINRSFATYVHEAMIAHNVARVDGKFFKD